MALGWGNPNTAVDQRAVQFVVHGSIRSDGTSIKMILKLTDTRTGRQIWSESSRSLVPLTNPTNFPHEDSVRGRTPERWQIPVSNPERERGRQ